MSKQTVPVATTPVVDAPPIKTDAQKISGETALYAIYLLYKLNVIDRYGIKGGLELLKKETPDSLLDYLVAETKKI